MAVNAVISFAITPMLIHGLGDVQFGMWVLAGSLLDYYGLLDMGIRTTVQRFVARFQSDADRDRQEVSTIASTALAISWFICVVVAAGSLVLATPVTLFFGVKGAAQVEFRQAIILLGLTLAITFPSRVLGAYLCGRQRFDVYNGAAVGVALVRALLLVIVIYTGSGLVGCAAVSLGTSALSLVLHWVFVHMIDPRLSIRWAHVDRHKARELWAFGYYVFVSSLGDLFRFRVDSFVIGRWVSLAMVTPFNIGSRLIEYMRQVMNTLIGPLITGMSELDSTGAAGVESLRRLFLKSTRLTSLMSMAMGIWLAMEGRNVISFWVGAQYASSARVLLILLLGHVIATSQSSSVSLLLARGRNRPLAWWTLGEGVANLVLSILWAKEYGIEGVAWGTTVPMLVTRLVLQPIYTLKFMDIAFSTYFRQALARPLAVLAIGYSVLRLTAAAPHASLLSFLFHAGVHGFILVALVYLIGLLKSERRQFSERFVAMLPRRGLASTVAAE